MTRWFKNLNTMPKLLLGFGVLIVAVAGIGYLGIRQIDNIDAQVSILYSNANALAEAKDLAATKLDAQRFYRDAILNVGKPDAIAANERGMKQALDEIHKHLTNAAQQATSPEAKTLVHSFQDSLSAYEEGVAEVFRRAKAGDTKGAMAAMAANSGPTRQLNETAVALGKLKLERIEEAKTASDAVFGSAVKTVMLIGVGAMLAGLVISVSIARMFAAPLVNSVLVLGKVAAGDLTQTLDYQSQDEVGRMAEALNTALGSMRTTLGEVSEAAEMMTSASQQLAMASSSMASGTHEQAASLEETSASLEEMTATVRQNADNAKQASQLALSSRGSAEKGGAVVSDAVRAMSEVNSSSEKIADIIGTVDEIAFQTNLLAVNAAVEAARAGEQGRGFAVVASEVRSLAQRSAVAAKEIKSLIGDSVQKARKGSELVNHSGQTLGEIVSSVKRVTDIVGEIASASQEQSLGIEQVNKAMLQMNQVTQNNAAQTEELHSTAESLSAQAHGLQQLVGRFKIGTEERGRVRANEVATRPRAGRPQPARPVTAVVPMQAAPQSRRKSTQSLINLADGVAREPVEAIPVSADDFEEF